MGAGGLGLVRWAGLVLDARAGRHGEGLVKDGEDGARSYHARDGDGSGRFPGTYILLTPSNLIWPLRPYSEYME